jgi:hypothetical protein
MRYYFNVHDKLPIEDALGREFDCAASAINHSRFLAADIRSSEPSATRSMAIRVLSGDGKQVHEEAVFQHL